MSAMDEVSSDAGEAASTVTAPRHRELALAGHPSPVAEGRDFIRQSMLGWYSLTEPEPAGQTITADIVLLVSELLTNACLHADGPLRVVVNATDEVLRIEVDDANPELPQPRSPRQPGIPGGHGLHIVDQLTDRWGAEGSRYGKTVWMEIDASRLSVC